MSRLFPSPRTLKVFACDLNWAKFDSPMAGVAPAMAADWAQVDPQEYFDWHTGFGVNTIVCQAYLFGGTALYPSRLGPVAPGTGAEFLPRLYELSRKAKLPFMSYFCAGVDLTVAVHRPAWIIPTSYNHAHHGFLAPESPWTDLLCARVAEFLTDYPVEWLMFDWFVYGSLHTDEFPVQPAWFARQPFEQLIGRPMPERAQEITAEESLIYKREILARQFHAIQTTVQHVSPGTRIMFNIPYWQAEEPIWAGHPMMNDSDCLFAECSREDVVQWLLRVKKPEQRVMTTIIGRVDQAGECEPDSWRKWYDRGVDLFGYAWGTPPDFHPHPAYQGDLDIVRRAFKEIG